MRRTPRRRRPSRVCADSPRAACPVSSCMAIGIFCCREQFCAMSGAQLLHDPVIITLYGEPVLVMHGDALCTDDHAYQRLRATVETPIGSASSWRSPINRAGRWPARPAPAAKRTPPRWNMPLRTSTPTAWPWRSAPREPRRYCMAIRIGRPFTPWRSMGGPVPASSWAIGTIKAVCCAGISTVPSFNRWRAQRAALGGGPE